MLTTVDIEKINGFAIARKAVAIYIFGSSATGKERPGSDIDLAVMVAGAFSGMARVEMETALMAAKELLYRKLSRLQIASFLRNMNMVLGAKSDIYQAV